MNSDSHVSDGLKSAETLQVSERLSDTKSYVKHNKKCTVSNRSRSALPLDGKLTGKSSKKKRKSNVEVPVMEDTSSTMTWRKQCDSDPNNPTNVSTKSKVKVANSSGTKHNKIMRRVKTKKCNQDPNDLSPTEATSSASKDNNNTNHVVPNESTTGFRPARREIKYTIDPIIDQWKHNGTDRKNSSPSATINLYSTSHKDKHLLDPSWFCDLVADVPFNVQNEAQLKLRATEPDVVHSTNICPIVTSTKDHSSESISAVALPLESVCVGLATYILLTLLFLFCYVSLAKTYLKINL
jgi:hypothetical protein